MDVHGGAATGPVANGGPHGGAGGGSLKEAAAHGEPMLEQVSWQELQMRGEHAKADFLVGTVTHG